MECGQAAADEFAAGLGVAHAFAHVEVEDGAAGVHGLEVLLLFEGFEGVIGVADGEHGGVGVVGGIGEAGLQDVGEAFLVFGDVVVVVGEVAHHFVDAVDADGGEVVVEAGEVALGVGVEAAVDEFVNLDALLFQGVFAQFHQFVDAGEEAFPVPFVLVA